MMRALLRLTVYLTFTLLCMPFQAFFLLVAPPLAKRFPVWYHRRCMRLFGITVEVVGQPSAQHPCLYLSNHSSYLDIPVLGSLMPICFVAKAEVARWPLFGQLAKLQQTLFIDRRTSQVAAGQSALAARLKAGDDLVLFPEGTSSDGMRVLPFRRALFQTALDHAKGLQLTLQPVSIYCAGMDGTPADRSARQLYAWFGDMDLLPHLWRYCHLRSSIIRVVFHPPLDSSAHADRVTLAAEAERVVAAGLASEQAA